MMYRKSKTSLAVIAAVAVAFLLSGCVSYNGSALGKLADRNLEAKTITIEMCNDFAAASQYAINGDDKAAYGLGKASTMTGLSVVMSKHSIQCHKTVRRLEDAENPLPEFHHGQRLSGFKRSWGNVKTLSK